MVIRIQFTPYKQLKFILKQPNICPLKAINTAFILKASALSLKVYIRKKIVNVQVFHAYICFEIEY